MSLRADILARLPDLAAERNDGAIAAALSVGRTKVGSVTREQFAGWAAGNGLRAKIEDCAGTPGHPLRSIALTLLDVLRGGFTGIDLSSASNQAMLAAWVAADAITQAQADELITLATTPDPITVNQVSDALNAEA